MHRPGRIAADHDLTRFHCGNPALDRWLKAAALRADAMGTARTYVWTENATVLAYFSLAPHGVSRHELPSGLAHGAPKLIPAFLLARLALDQRLRGRGLGTSLLLDALSKAIAAIEIAGGRVIVVDALDEQAIRFYEHYGFRSAPDRPARLFRKASQVAASLGQR